MDGKTKMAQGAGLEPDVFSGFREATLYPSEVKT